MKTCNECGLDKDYFEFNKSKARKDGFASKCKVCINIYEAKQYRLKKNIPARIHKTQKRHSKNRGQALPTYTKEELRDWLYSQPEFHRLYDNWKRLDFQQDYSPSVDRKINSISYTIDNIQLMTWNENRQKEFDARYKGMYNGKAL